MYRYIHCTSNVLEDTVFCRDNPHSLSTNKKTDAAALFHSFSPYEDGQSGADLELVSLM